MNDCSYIKIKRRNIIEIVYVLDVPIFPPIIGQKTNILFVSWSFSSIRGEKTHVFLKDKSVASFYSILGTKTHVHIHLSYVDIHIPDSVQSVRRGSRARQCTL